VARITEVLEEDEVFTVSFLQKQKDGYVWPEVDDRSTVGRCELLKLSTPDEEIVSAASSHVRVKLLFARAQLVSARIRLDCVQSTW